VYPVYSTRLSSWELWGLQEVGTIIRRGSSRDQQLLPEPKHSVHTPQWLCKFQVAVLIRRNVITLSISFTAFTSESTNVVGVLPSHSSFHKLLDGTVICRENYVVVLCMLDVVMIPGFRCQILSITVCHSCVVCFYWFYMSYFSNVFGSFLFFSVFMIIVSVILPYVCPVLSMWFEYPELLLLFLIAYICSLHLV
jgi:hypothetical protein